MLQLAYLQMTQPRKDAAIYSAYVDRQRELAQMGLCRAVALNASREELAAAMADELLAQRDVPAPERLGRALDAVDAPPTPPEGPLACPGCGASTWPSAGPGSAGFTTGLTNCRCYLFNQVNTGGTLPVSFSAVMLSAALSKYT